MGACESISAAQGSVVLTRALHIASARLVIQQQLAVLLLLLLLAWSYAPCTASGSSDRGVCQAVGVSVQHRSE